MNYSKKKYEIIRFQAVIRLKLANSYLISGEKALLEALERAVNENSAFGEHILANHSTSLPFEAIQDLAEELLLFCQREYSEADYIYLRTSAERFLQTYSKRQESNTKKWALYYWFLMEANIMPELQGAKKRLKEIAQKHNIGEDNFYQTFNAVNRKRAKNPMKVDILKQVIPLLEEYPEAKDLAEKELQKHISE